MEIKAIQQIAIRMDVNTYYMFILLIQPMNQLHLGTNNHSPTYSPTTTNYKELYDASIVY